MEAAEKNQEKKFTKNRYYMVYPPEKIGYRALKRHLCSMALNSGDRGIPYVRACRELCDSQCKYGLRLIQLDDEGKVPHAKQA